MPDQLTVFLQSMQNLAQTNNLIVKFTVKQDGVIIEFSNNSVKVSKKKRYVYKVEDLGDINYLTIMRMVMDLNMANI